MLLRAFVYDICIVVAIVKSFKVVKPMYIDSSAIVIISTVMIVGGAVMIYEFIAFPFTAVS